MDKRTGKLYMLTEEEKDNLNDELIPIDINDATDKQRENMLVSLHDHRSKLGKVLTKTRRENVSKRKKRRNKKKIDKCCSNCFYIENCTDNESFQEDIFEYSCDCWRFFN